jgi:low affinity Fe/Cu permease
MSSPCSSCRSSRRSRTATAPRSRPLDELIKVNKEARNDLIGIEDRDEEEIEEMRAAPDSVTDPRPEEGVPVA